MGVQSVQTIEGKKNLKGSTNVCVYIYINQSITVKGKWFKRMKWPLDINAKTKHLTHDTVEKLTGAYMGRIINRVLHNSNHVN